MQSLDIQMFKKFLVAVGSEGSKKDLPQTLAFRAISLYYKTPGVRQDNIPWHPDISRGFTKPFLENYWIILLIISNRSNFSVPSIHNFHVSLNGAKYF
jgi:hypothetical protein